jgi:hypothetical protein
MTTTYVEHPKVHYVGPGAFKCTTGTWTLTSSSGKLYQAKSAADETPVVSIPIGLPYLVGEFGPKLTKIEVPLRITTADLDAVIAGSLYQVNDYKAVAAAGTNIDTTAITITETGTAVTAAATDRLYTATVTTPAYPLTSTITVVHYQLDLSINCAAGTVLWVYGANVYYTDIG